MLSLPGFHGPIPSLMTIAIKVSGELHGELVGAFQFAKCAKSQAEEEAKGKKEYFEEFLLLFV